MERTGQQAVDGLLSSFLPLLVFSTRGSLLMYVGELLETASLLAFHGKTLITECSVLNVEALGDYWQASRCRLDRWGRALRDGHGLAADELMSWFQQSVPLFEEILVSEILTRTTAAFLAAHDDAHDGDDAGPIGRNILQGHVEARSRAMRIVAGPFVAKTTEAARVVSLSRRCRLWNDVLLAYLANVAPIEEFAFDKSRVIEFSFDACVHQRMDRLGDALPSTLSTTLQLAFQSLADVESPNTDLNAQICAALIGCLGPEFFDSHGLLRSAWLRRLETIPDETLAVIDRFWSDEPIPAKNGPQRRKK